MYKIAWGVFVKALPLLFLLGVLIEAFVLFFGQGAANAGAEFILAVSLALLFHRVILLDEDISLWGRAKDHDGVFAKLPFLPFLGRFFLVMLPLAVIFILSVVALWPLITRGGTFSSYAFFSAMIPAVLVFPFWAGGVGTMLPAAATGGDASWKAAFCRGRQTYWATVGRLWVGPILFVVLSIAVVVVLLSVAPISDAATFFASSVGFAISVVVTIVGFVPPLLTATALSMAYRRAEFDG